MYQPDNAPPRLLQVHPGGFHRLWCSQLWRELPETNRHRLSQLLARVIAHQRLLDEEETPDG